MNYKAYIALAAAAMLVMPATAQNQGGTPDLNKEITLEKDFIPVEKKATKKNTLPQVKKIAPPQRTSVTYSDWANPTDVPSSIPTMMPYGYRTAHNFSDKRGYLDMGGGTHANFAGSVGYRLIDTDDLTLNAWLQHNSTWNGRNASPLIVNESDRLKQKFNDNRLGVDLTSNFAPGTLTINALAHFDSFNYYGGWDEAWDDDNKQSFLDFRAGAAWEGQVALNDNEISYNLGASVNHASYDINPFGTGKGAKETLAALTAGGEYQLPLGTVGLQITGDYFKRSSVGLGLTNILPNYVPNATFDAWTLTLSPYYKWENEVFRAMVGVDMLFGKPFLNIYNPDDDSKFHISPRVKIDLDIVDGAAIFVDVSGGLNRNTLSTMAADNRYSDPLGAYGNSFSVVDGEAGFNIGPFQGFSAKLYGGYSAVKNDINIALKWHNTGVAEPVPDYRFSTFEGVNLRGARVGADLRYDYRSLVEAKASAIYYPISDDETVIGKWNNCYTQDWDGTTFKFKFDVKVNPIRRLSVDAGVELRTGRCVYIYENLPTIAEGNDYTSLRSLGTLKDLEMEDFIDLHAGASYRFDKVVTLWTRAGNLLNRRQDILPGMGAQRINIMAGVGLVF